MKKYKVAEDAEMMAPKWLSARIDHKIIKFVYWNEDGAVRLKGGVRIGNELAGIGDTIAFDGRRLSVEMR